MSTPTSTAQQQAGRQVRRDEGGGTQVTDLDPTLYQALRQASFDQHKPMTEIVREALRSHLRVR
jgi:hypothetical protein